MKRAIAITALLAASLVVPINAQAAEMVVKPAKTSELAAEETIAITLEKFPTKAGVYLQQCAQPAAGARPTDCNAQTQLWITNARGGSFTPNAAITMKLVAKFGAVDCTTTKCGIFARYDHTAGTDTSEDQFLPISFAAGAPMPITPISTVEKQGISKLPKSMKVGQSLSLPVQTLQGTTITYRTTSKKFCTLQDNVVRAVKTGVCKVQVFAPASEKYEMFALNYNLNIKKR
jgi:hypothetical protein